MPRLTPTFEKIFRVMAARKASDVFLSVGSALTIKIEGVAQPISAQTVTEAQAREWLKELLGDEAAWQRFEATREANFALYLPEVGNFRCNLFWQKGTPAGVFRYIPPRVVPLEQLGVPPVVGDLVKLPRGLVLIVGATGSGKSTTLAAMVEHRNQTIPGHILTVEDPIEFVFQPKRAVINQRDLGQDTLSWADALKNAMRQAPDCIVIGEIRDRDTMQAALSYALTGHLVLASLHANNAYHAINRIINMFPLENRPLLYSDLAVALRAILAQRLLPGVTGKRVVAVEVLVNTQLIAEAIEKGDLFAIKEAMQRSLTDGAQTFDMALLELVRSGKINREVALRYADSATNLAWMLDNTGAGPNRDTTAAFPTKATPPPQSAAPTAPAPDDFSGFRFLS